MRRLLALFMAACLVFPTVSVFAESDWEDEEESMLKVTQEDFYIVDNFMLTGYYFARVENIGEETVRVGSCEVTVFDKEGEEREFLNWETKTKEYLEPGEYTYIMVSGSFDELESADEADHVELDIYEDTYVDEMVLYLPCEPDLEADVKEHSWEDWLTDYLIVTATNDTEEPLSEIKAAMVLLDEDGHILDIQTSETYYDVELMPGSSLRFRRAANTSLTELEEEMGRTGVKVEACVYVKRELD